MVRILHCADIHLGTSFARMGLPPTVGNTLREELRSTLGSILSDARRLQVDAVTFAGDLYEQSTAVPDTARFLRQQFDRMGSTQVLIAPGERDAYSAHSLYAHTQWPRNVHVFSSPEFQPFKLSPSVTIWGAACPIPEPAAWQQQIVDHPGSTNVMLAHATDTLSSKSSLVVVSENVLQRTNVQLALLGGSHSARVPVAGERIVFPGSPQPLDWGDTDVERGVVLVSIEDGRCTFEQIRFRTWRLVDIAVSVEECHKAEEVADRIERELTLHDSQRLSTVVAKVILHGEPAGDFTLADVRAAMPSEANVVLYRSFAFPYDLDQLAMEQTVRGTLVRNVRGQLNATNDADAKKDLLAALKIVLLALDGRQVHLDAIG